MAPTAANFQLQRIFVLERFDTLDKSRKVTPFCINAPIVLMIYSDSNISWKAVDGHDSDSIDAAIAITQMMLESFDEGIGSCWIRGFDKNILSSVFQLPDNLEPVALLPIDYPDKDSKPALGFSDTCIPI